MTLAEELAQKYGPPKHFECEDPWYSCPLSEEGCANDGLTECNCGFDYERSQIAAAVNDALERAAKIAEDAATNHDAQEQIRALKSKP